MAKTVLTAGALALILGLLVGCGGNESQKQVRGHIVEVIGRNITEIETLQLRDDNGKIWRFATQGFTGFSPSHLREHQLFGQQVIVFYFEKNNELIAVNITD